MYAYFNELSAYPYVASDAVVAAIDGFADACRELREYGIKKIACEDGPGSVQLSETETLHSYCSANRRDIKVQLLLSIFTKPYLAEDSSEEERFVNHTYAVVIVNPNGEPETLSNPMGLASAHIYDSFVVSFGSTAFWKSTKSVSLTVNDGKRESARNIKNVSEANDLDDRLRNHIAEKVDRRWIKSSKRPDDKAINLSSDHHGNGKLKDFAKKSLRPLEYFEEVSTSLEYDPNCRHFVKTIHTASMQIDVVLYREDRGYSMRIKTTAKSDLELRQIACDLESRFGVQPTEFKSL